MQRGSVSRQGFFKTAVQAGAAAAGAPMIVPSSVLGQRAGAVPHSDRIVLGGIGIGRRGGDDLRALLSFRQARFVAICDVKNQRRPCLLGRKLTWDPVKKEFPGEDLANRMPSRALREPWRI